MTSSSAVGIAPVAHNLWDVVLTSDQDLLGKPVLSCNNKEIGRCGEDLAALYLESKGFEILERNWCSPFGEADIIAEDNGMLVLVEVKTRVTQADDGEVAPEIAVNYRKRSRYEKLALLYLAKQTRLDAVRFDVVAVKLVSPHEARLRHLSGAYEWDN